MFTVEMINTRLKDDALGFVEECEESYHSQLRLLTEKICNKKGRQLIMLAGPSSSGKTTTASIIKDISQRHSRGAFVVSLDDFYKNDEETIYFEDGTPDYETIDALDTELISECLLSLEKSGECYLPKFDFIKSKRNEEFTLLKAEKDDIIIVEGLHAINPLITSKLDISSLTKVYVSVSSRILKDEKTFLSKRELRFIRRLIRDFHHRNSSVDNTFYLWKAVRMGEDRYLFPFSRLADVRIDSIHPFEPCLFKDEAIRLLDLTGSHSVYFKTAKDLIDRLECFESLDKSYLPENSLLNEFLE